MKIGIFTDAYLPFISGVVSSITTLENELIKLGHEVYIFTLYTDDNIKKNKPNLITFKGLRMPFKHLKSYRFSLLLRFKSSVIKKYNLDLIHIQTEFSMARFGLICAKRYKIPCVYTLHTLYEDYVAYIAKSLPRKYDHKVIEILASILIKPITKQANIKIVPTRKVLAQISSYKIEGDVRVIPTGIDLEQFNTNNIANEKVENLKKDLGISKEDLVILSIGRLSPEKSLDKCIDAFSKCIQENVKFVIVGDGPIYNSLVEKTKELNISNNVIFTGFIKHDDIALYYKLGDVFINASTSETQGLTYIEALASSLPLVVKYDECILDIVKNNYNGYIFNDENQLVDILNKLIKNKNILLSMKENARTSSLEYSKEIFAKKIENIYFESLEKHKEKKEHFFTK